MKHIFSPTELIFSPISLCNLRCAHCNIRKYKTALPLVPSLRFLKSCAAYGIKRVGFTGGEPFLALDFILPIVRETIKQNMLFGRISTNGLWFKSVKELKQALIALNQVGYDGDISLSIDAFHAQNMYKAAQFIRYTIEIFNRSDMISIASVKGLRDKDTFRLLRSLAKVLSARIVVENGFITCISHESLILKIFYNYFSHAGAATYHHDPWDNHDWFKDDYCCGPGNIFFVSPDGSVSPCCGYANHMDVLALGTIKDSPACLVENARNNRFVNHIFTKGFHPLRRLLEKRGVKFPGRTVDHCFFCEYLAKMRYVNKDSFVVR